MDGPYRSHGDYMKTCGQEDDEDNIGQVEEDDVIVALDRGWTHIYIGDDEGGVNQVKKKGGGIRPW